MSFALLRGTLFRKGRKILIAGEYGGELPGRTKKGEQVLIQETNDHITTITFILNQSKEVRMLLIWRE